MKRDAIDGFRDLSFMLKLEAIATVALYVGIAWASLFLAVHYVF